MQCEKCNKQIEEGNFIYVPCHKQTAGGVIASFLHIVVCNDCAVTIPNQIVGAVKVAPAEIVPEHHTENNNEIQ